MKRIINRDCEYVERPNYVVFFFRTYHQLSQSNSNSDTNYDNNLFTYFIHIRFHKHFFNEEKHMK